MVKNNNWKFGLLISTLLIFSLIFIQPASATINDFRSTQSAFQNLFSIQGDLTCCQACQPIESGTILPRTRVDIQCSGRSALIDVYEIRSDGSWRPVAEYRAPRVIDRSSAATGTYAYECYACNLGREPIPGLTRCTTATQCNEEARRLGVPGTYICDQGSCRQNCDANWGSGWSTCSQEGIQTRTGTRPAGCQQTNLRQERGCTPPGGGGGGGGGQGGQGGTGTFNTGSIIITDVVAPKTALQGELVEIKVTFKNTAAENQNQDVYAEAGIYPDEWVSEQYDISINEFYSIFPSTFSIVRAPEKCQESETFVDRVKISALGAGQSESFTFAVRAPTKDTKFASALGLGKSAFDYDPSNTFISHTIVVNTHPETCGQTYRSCFRGPNGQGPGCPNFNVLTSNLNGTDSPEIDCAKPYKVPSDYSFDLGVDIGSIHWGGGQARCSDGLTKKGFQKATDLEVLNAICEESRNCNVKEGYDVECVNQETAGVKLPIAVSAKIIDSISDFLLGMPDNEPGLCLATETKEGGSDFFVTIGKLFAANSDEATQKNIGIGVVIAGVIILLLLMRPK